MELESSGSDILLPIDSVEQNLDETVVLIDHVDYKRIREILGCYIAALELISETSVIEFSQDRHKKIALFSLLQSGGRAANGLSKDARKALPAVPWIELGKLGNDWPIAHARYNTNLIWREVTLNVPRYVPLLQKALSQIVPVNSVEESLAAPFAIETSSNKAIRERYVRSHRPFLPLTSYPSIVLRLLTSNDPALKAYRTTLDLWFRNLPESDRISMYRRLKSGCNAEHMSAVWELFFHQFFLDNGWNPTKEPWLAGCRPDYWVVAGDNGFLMEVTTCCGSQEIQESKWQFHKLLEVLNKIASPYLLEVHMENWCTTIQKDAVAELVETWLKSLTATCSAKNELPISCSGFKGRVLATRKDTFATEQGCVYSWKTPSDVLNNVESLRTKASRYNMPWAVPLVISSCLQDNMELDESAVCNYLYGDFELSVKRGEDRKIILRSRHGNSFGPSMHVSAAIIATRRWRDNKFEYDLRVFHNPWAKHKLERSLFKLWPQLVPEESFETSRSLVWI